MPGNSPQTIRTNDAPLPVLGQNYGMAAPMTWKDAPEAVRSAVSLSILGAVLYGIATLVYTFVAIQRQFEPESMGALLGGGVACAINLYMIRAHRNHVKSAWANQRALSFLGLVLQFPFGTIFHILILARWYRRETKHWYGIE